MVGRIPLRMAAAALVSGVVIWCAGSAASLARPGDQAGQTLTVVFRDGSRQELRLSQSVDQVARVEFGAGGSPTTEERGDVDAYLGVWQDYKKSVFGTITISRAPDGSLAAVYTVNHGRMALRARRQGGRTVALTGTWHENIGSKQYSASLTISLASDGKSCDVEYTREGSSKTYTTRLLR